MGRVPPRASGQSHAHLTGFDLINARQFYSKYGRDVPQTLSCFKKKALEVLSTAINGLDRLGVRFWLSSGTCLGDGLLDSLSISLLVGLLIYLFVLSISRSRLFVFSFIRSSAYMKELNRRQKTSKIMDSYGFILNQELVF